MVIRHVLLQLKKAVASDFKKEGKYLVNVPFFYQDYQGVISPTIHYLNQDNVPDFFKDAFNEGRIYTLVDPNEVLKVCEETFVEWNTNY